MCRYIRVIFCIIFFMSGASWALEPELCPTVERLPPEGVCIILPGDLGPIGGGCADNFLIDAELLSGAMPGFSQIFTPVVGGQSRDEINLLEVEQVDVLDENEGCICVVHAFWTCWYEECNGPSAKWRVAVAPAGTNLPSLQDRRGQFEPRIEALPIKNFTDLKGPFISVSDSNNCEWWEVDEGDNPIGPQTGTYHSDYLWDWDNFCFEDGCYDELEILVYETDDCRTVMGIEGCNPDDVIIHFTIRRDDAFFETSNRNARIVLALRNIDTDSDLILDDDEVRIGTDPNNPDTDGDGLDDWEEINTYSLDPLDSDVDDDGLSDGAEILDHFTDPRDPDVDDDGLSDGDEVLTYGSDPHNQDTDDDGINDGREVMLGLNPTRSDNPVIPIVVSLLLGGDDTAGDVSDRDGDGVADLVDNCPEVANPDQTNTDGDDRGDVCDGDDDNDGLLDADEAARGTNPRDTDSDDDGLNDGVEVSRYSTDPMDQDSDDDGLIDGDEVIIRLTDPLNPDTDNDGINDGREVALGLNPTRSDNPVIPIIVSLLLSSEDSDEPGDLRPDLVIENVEILGTGTFRRGVRMRVTVANRGGTAISDAFWVGSRPDWYTKPGFNTTHRFMSGSESLAPGASVQKIIYLPRAESWELTIDATNRIDEADEDNNTRVVESRE